MELETRRFLVQDVVEGAAALSAQLADQKGLTTHTFVDPRIPPVLGDPNRLRQILLNLLANAVNFTDQGHIAAHAFLLDASEDAVTLRFEIDDTGVGIAPDVVPRLFEPFAQGQISGAPRSDGTGLGLSISKKLVELMSGEIGVESAPGRGSSFWFVLQLPTAGVALKHRPLDGIVAVILSADDTFAQIAQRYLSLWGMSPHFARTPADVDAAVQSAPEATCVGIVDQDAASVGTLLAAVGAARARLRSRVVTIGDGAIRKPVRQAYLFHALAKAAGVDHLLPAPAAGMEHTVAIIVPAPILVAEDNPRLQALLQMQFEELGVPATFVSDGTQAVEAAARGTFSGVLMDVQMPTMDGLSATRAIRAEEVATGRHVPIAAMTANAFAEDREACVAAGMDDYLAKPVRIAQLRALIERLVAAYASESAAS